MILFMKLSENDSCRDRKYMNDCQGLEIGRVVVYKRSGKRNFGDDRTTPYHDCDGGYIDLNCC